MPSKDQDVLGVIVGESLSIGNIKIHDFISRTYNVLLYDVDCKG